MIQGVDVSYWQGSNINWPLVANSGVQFAYIKSTEGVGRIEPMAHSQSIGAQGAGIKIGYYHFANAGGDSALAEATFFDRIIKTLPKADLIPVLDIETNKFNLSAQQMTKWMEDFVSCLHGLGYPNIMLYSYTPFFNQYLLPSTILAPTKLWIAQYTHAQAPSLPHGYTKYDVWQYSNTGSVTGIGQCDVNICSVLPLASP